MIAFAFSVSAGSATPLIALTPSSFAVATCAFVVAALIFVTASSFACFVWAFAASFSSVVKAVLPSISWSFVVFACSTALIAFAFSVSAGSATPLIALTPLFFAVFNVVSSWAFSIFRIALSFAVLANSFNSVFSSLVRELSWSIWLVLFVNAVFTSFFAPSLFNVGVGKLGKIVSLLQLLSLSSGLSLSLCSPTLIVSE